MLAGGSTGGAPAALKDVWPTVFEWAHQIDMPMRKT